MFPAIVVPPSRRAIGQVGRARALLHHTRAAHRHFVGAGRLRVLVVHEHRVSHLHALLLVPAVRVAALVARDVLRLAPARRLLRALHHLDALRDAVGVVVDHQLDGAQRLVDGLVEVHAADAVLGRRVRHGEGEGGHQGGDGSDE